MNIRFLATIALCALPFAALAHDNEHSVTTSGDLTCIMSNGAPSHEMGTFPTRGNPHSYSEQDLQFCFPTNPTYTGQAIYGDDTVGVTTEGVPIRPYTAEYYDDSSPRGYSRQGDRDWRLQAMYDPASLGMDAQNAHVDHSGLYHYHAISPALADEAGTLIGYAPDGFEIHYSPSTATSSWQLKSGTRPSDPYGTYDGTFEGDFEYVAGSGTLDECNGGMVNGTYTYFATDTYPFYPRCVKGETTSQFMVRSH